MILQNPKGKGKNPSLIEKTFLTGISYPYSNSFDEAGDVL